MTPWTLIWEPAAEQMLAAVYLAAFDQAAVTRAEYGAEAILATDPTRFAVPLPEGLWKLTVGPVVIFFSVEEAARVVHVSDVAWLPTL
ncbi:MAG: hypothetical protein MUF18_00400 [Fimbriiglobus sp.]|nr:hypothetical protein [Fimbriiglobus sp.]